MPIEKQIGYLSDATKLLEDKEKDHNYIISVSSSLHVKGINWIKTNDLHRLFVLRKKGDEKELAELFRQFGTKCNFIDSMSETLNNTINHLLTKFDKYQLKWDEDITKIRNQYDLARTEFERRGDTPYPFFIEFDKLLGAWSHMTDYIERPIAVDKFLIPLQAECRKTKGDHFAIEVLHVIADCLHTYDNIKGLKEFTVLNFKTVCDDLKEANGILQKIMDDYDNKYMTIQEGRKHFIHWILSPSN